MRKYFVWLLSVLCLLFFSSGLFSMTAFASSLPIKPYLVEGEGFREEYDNLCDAFNALDHLPNEKYTIWVRSNVTESSSSPVEFTCQKNVTLKSLEGPFTITQEALPHITIFYGGTLTIENVILDGGQKGGGIKINNGNPTLNFGQGAQLNNCKALDIVSNNGCVYAGRHSTAVINVLPGASFSGNKAKYGGVFYIGGSNKLSITGGVFTGNASEKSGGAIMVDADAAVSASNVIFTNNTANRTGGAIMSQSSQPLLIDRCQFDENAATWGGAIYSINCKASLLDCSFEKNYALYLGGGYFAQNNNDLLIYIDNCRFIANTAKFIANGTNYGSGAGVYLEIGNCLVKECIFAQNYALQTGAGVFCEALSSCTFENCQFESNISDMYGGGAYVYYDNQGPINFMQCHFNNNRSLNGGGLFTRTAEVNIHNCSFTGNAANASDDESSGYGGGLSAYSIRNNTGEACKLNMNGSSFIGNSAAFGGGGFYSQIDLANIEQCSFTQNNSGDAGGGIAVSEEKLPAIFNVKNTRLEQNTAEINGGGLCLSEGTVNFNTGNEIINNQALKGNGGGIYVAHGSNEDPCDITAYDKLNTSKDTIFRGNTAAGWCLPPSNAASLTNIQFTSTSFDHMLWKVPHHPLNNYDINYANPKEKAVLTYHANGITDESGQDLSRQAVVYKGEDLNIRGASDLGFVREGWLFAGWNTAADGSGTTYSAGQTLPVREDMDLYAVWASDLKTITYHGNGAVDVNGHELTAQAQVQAGQSLVIAAPADLSFVREGWLFAGWNTAADGSGTAYHSGQEIVLTQDMDLFAVWELIPEPERSYMTDPLPPIPTDPIPSQTAYTPIAATSIHASAPTPTIQVVTKLPRTGEAHLMLPAALSILLMGAALALLSRKLR